MTNTRHTRIADIANIRIGYQPKGPIRTDAKAHWRIIQLSDFNKFDSLQENSLSKFRPDRGPDRYRVRVGDVLFPYRGHNNKAKVILKDLGDVVAAGYFYIITLKTNQVQPAYLAWYLNQSPSRSYFERTAKQGSHMPMIARHAFEGLEVLIPPHKIQRLVVMLDDETRRERRLSVELSELYEKLAAAVSINVLNPAKQRRNTNGRRS